MTLVRPVKDSTVKGRILLDAVAPYHVGVTKVTFSVTGGALRNAVVGTGSFSDYGWLSYWNTVVVKNGTYTLRSAAYDSSGNSSACPAISVKVAN